MCVGAVMKTDDDAMSDGDNDDFFGSVLDDRSSEDRDGRDRRDDREDRDRREDRSSSSSSSSSESKAKIAAFFKNKWVWIAIGGVVGLGAGILVGAVWFKVINTRVEKEKLENAGAVVDPDKINSQKRTAVMTSIIVAIVVGGGIVLGSKFIAKW
jgi:hypothetical protein